MAAQNKLIEWIVLHKKRGETPLEVVKQWKMLHPAYADVPMSYAGRLDPMAEGKLLVLIGDECKRQAAYTGLDKEYEIEVLLGVQTDTGDVLGLPMYRESAMQLHALPLALRRELGAHSRRYPVYSSKTVAGKPLFMYALEGTLDTITIPEHIERMYSIKQLGSYELTRDALRSHIAELLSSVSRTDEASKELGADFRQDAIRQRWDELLSLIPDRSFRVIRLRVTCASGAYMRTLAERIGASLNTSALALSINRTKIGRLLSLGALHVWLKTYK